MQETQSLNKKQTELSFEQKLVLATEALIKLRALNVFCKLEAHESGHTEFTFYSTSNLLELKKLLKTLGIHVNKIDKKVYDSTISNSQYAIGKSQEGISIYVHPNGATFEGCKIVEIEEPVQIPEKHIPAQEEQIIPAHTEYIKRRVVKCGKAAQTL